MILKSKQVAILFMILALSLAGNVFALGWMVGAHHGKDRIEQARSFDKEESSRHRVMKTIRQAEGRLSGVEQQEFKQRLSSLKEIARGSFREMRALRQEIQERLRAGEELSQAEMEGYFEKLRHNQDNLQKALHEGFLQTLPHLSPEEKRDFIQEMLRAEFRKDERGPKHRSERTVPRQQMRPPEGTRDLPPPQSDED